MERLCDLLFELSNEDRLNMLHLLETEDMRLSHISKRLDFTVQETSRRARALPVGRAHQQTVAVV